MWEFIGLIIMYFILFALGGYIKKKSIIEKLDQYTNYGDVSKKNSIEVLAEITKIIKES